MSEEKDKSLSKKEFLKKRRPERFSDSVDIEVGSLDRAVLEHQLPVPSPSPCLRSVSRSG